MGQAEIQTLLKKEGKFLSTEEIVQKLKNHSQRSSIVTALRQMLKYKEVIRKNGERGPYGGRRFFWMLK